MTYIPKTLKDIEHLLKNENGKVQLNGNLMRQLDLEKIKEIAKKHNINLIGHDASIIWTSKFNNG